MVLQIARPTGIGNALPLQSAVTSQLPRLTPLCLCPHVLVPTGGCLNLLCAPKFHHARVHHVDLLDDFQQPPLVPQSLHLFADGAFLAPTCRVSRLAAWGVVLADDFFPLSQQSPMVLSLDGSKQCSEPSCMQQSVRCCLPFIQTDHAPCGLTMIWSTNG